MCCLSQNSCNDDVKLVEHLQDSLRTQFAILEQAQLDVSGSVRPPLVFQDDDTASQFDNLNDEVADSGTDPVLALDPL